MRYPAGHKEQTKNRIVETAAALFRKRGYNGVGIDTLMEEAGLTRGGFYAYFRSKKALLRAVLEFGHDFVVRLKSRDAKNQRGLAQQGLEIAQAYVDRRNNKPVIGGCSLAALAIDCVRADAATQRAYGSAVRSLAAEFGRGLKHPDDLDERALHAVAICVGSLLIQNAAAADQELAQRMSSITQARLAEILRF